jgi:hypothetical protein
MSDTDQGDAIPPDDEGMLALRERERSLAADSGNWSVDSLGGTYVLTADGDEDLEDDALILAGHGYVVSSKQVVRDHVEVTFSRRSPTRAEELPLALTRVYYGKPDEAYDHMAEDAAELAKDGYVPILQNYVPGQWSCGQWVGAFFLMVLLVGFIILVYMAINRPAGTLTVVYELRRPIPAARSGERRGRASRARPRLHARHGLPGVGLPAPDASDPTTPATVPVTVEDRLRKLDELHSGGLITDDEHASRRRQIIEST